MYTVAVLMLCAGIMAWARWARSSDSNALVLQAREKALVAEQEKQRILAANMERDRISASIQAEVTATLNSVISQAVDDAHASSASELQLRPAAPLEEQLQRVSR